MTPVDRRGRALECVASAGAEVVLAVNPATVTWLTGYAPDIETGPNPFAAPPMVLVEPDGATTLVVAEDEAASAAAAHSPIATYTGYTLEPIRALRHATSLIASLVGQRRVATEGDALPAIIAKQISWIPVDAELAALRVVKDLDEIVAVRAAIKAADAGQLRLRECLRAGMSEVEIFGQVRTAIELYAGARVPVLADCISGPRTEGGGGPPGARCVANGELVICDLVPRVAGYWGDSCATVAVGEPSREAQRMHGRVLAALYRGIDHARPGVLASELDAVVRADMYSGHTGHGVGTTYHEAPRIVPTDNTSLEPGMVIALEPGCYERGFGIRLEYVVLITNDGCEPLSSHSLDL